MTKDYTVNRVGETRDRLGEGPLWDVQEQALYWLDSRGPVIHRLDPASGKRQDWTLPSTVGSMALREQGGAVVALETGFHFFDFETTTSRNLSTLIFGVCSNNEGAPCGARDCLRRRG